MWLRKSFHIYLPSPSLSRIFRFSQQTLRFSASISLYRWKLRTYLNNFLVTENYWSMPYRAFNENSIFFLVKGTVIRLINCAYYSKEKIRHEWWNSWHILNLHLIDNFTFIRTFASKDELQSTLILFFQYFVPSSSYQVISSYGFSPWTYACK